MTITQEFNRYKILPKTTNETDEISNKDFSLQNHQQFLKSYVSSNHFNTNNRILLYHGMGSGKTCSAITVACAFKLKHGEKTRIVTVTPASLITNFKNEIKGTCGMTQFEGFVSLKPNKLSQQIDKLFNITSYEKFVKNVKNENHENYDEHTLLIVDEVQNILNKCGKRYQTILGLLSTTKIALVILSGTPLFDDYKDIELIGNMLRLQKEQPVTIDFKKEKDSQEGEEFEVMDKKRLYNLFRNKVSYFRGKDTCFYPQTTEYYVYCKMSKFQYQGYLKSLGETNLDFDYENMSSSFLCGPRSSSNIVYPNGSITRVSASKYKNELFSAKKHAIKMYTCVQRIKLAKGPVFVFSNFVKACGVDIFSSLLINQFGFEEYYSEMGTTVGVGMRFAVFRTGNPKKNCQIIETFNSINNKNGDLIKAIIGSPTMKEGCTLLRTREVHILDPYWNRSRTDQIIGRAVRFCSHTSLPTLEQRVDVYHYLAVSPEMTIQQNVVKRSDKQPEMNVIDLSVDAHIVNISNHKQRAINAYEQILKDIAIDCELFANSNQPPVFTCRADVFEEDNTPPLVTKQKKQMSKTPATKSRTTKTPATKSRTTKNDIGQKESTRIVFEKKTGCPKKRQIINRKCPESHPEQRDNKHGAKCCYKNSKISTDIKKCLKNKKQSLLEEARVKGYTGPSVPKKKLCEYIVGN
jgi:hypothetical protein